MIRLIKTLILVSLFIFLGSCSRNVVAKHYPASGFPYRHSDFDYKVAWRTTQADSVVIIEGILKNVRYAYIDDLVLTVYLLGPDGKTRKHATSIPIPQHSRMDEVIPFYAKIKNAALNQGDTLVFTLQYQGSEGGMDGVNWHSTFAVDAMTGALRHKETVKPEEW
jgi:hypothetical protein